MKKNNEEQRKDKEGNRKRRGKANIKEGRTRERRESERARHR